MVTTFYPPQSFGGDGLYVQRLARALARRGCAVEVIHDADAWRVLGGARSGTVPPASEGEPPGVTVHRLDSGFPLASVLLTQQLGRPVVHARRLRSLLARDFDVIHYHNVSLIGGPGVLALGNALKFYTPHEHWLVCPTHVLWRHNRERCTGRECLRCTLIYRRPPQLWRATRWLDRQCEHVDAFIALSRSVADNHRAFGFTREMTLMASFLPDSERDADRVAGEAAVAAATRAGTSARDAESGPYFLFVGRLEALKGVQQIIPLFGDDAAADLVIAGSGAFERELRRLAAGRRRITFVGHVTGDALRSLYRNALALIAPSLCDEVFPMVVLESFCQRTPIIARGIGPYPQIVAESGAGLLFRDEGELRAAMAAIAGDRALRERLGALGRRAVETRWSEGTAIAAYLGLVRATARARACPEIAAKADRLRASARG
jgi:glycosyltransferase involved in cell wall biosynthesis